MYNNNITIRNVSQHKKSAKIRRRQEIYSQIENVVNNLSKGQAKIVGSFLWFKVRGLSIRPSQTTLAHMTGLSREWINKCVKYLREIGLIRYISRYWNTCIYETYAVLSNDYFLSAVYAANILQKGRLFIMATFARIPRAIAAYNQKFTLMLALVYFSIETGLVEAYHTRRAIPYCAENDMQSLKINSPPLSTKKMHEKTELACKKSGGCCILKGKEQIFWRKKSALFKETTFFEETTMNSITDQSEHIPAIVSHVLQESFHLTPLGIIKISCYPETVLSAAWKNFKMRYQKTKIKSGKPFLLFIIICNDELTNAKLLYDYQLLDALANKYKLDKNGPYTLRDEVFFSDEARPFDHYSTHRQEEKKEHERKAKRGTPQKGYTVRHRNFDATYSILATDDEGTLVNPNKPEEQEFADRTSPEFVAYHYWRCEDLINPFSPVKSNRGLKVNREGCKALGVSSLYNPFAYDYILFWLEDKIDKQPLERHLEEFKSHQSGTTAFSPGVKPLENVIKNFVDKLTEKQKTTHKKP